jgi:hemoglobin
MSEVTLFEALGGEPVIRRLVDAFYDHMDQLPAFAGIRALHPPQLQGSRDKLYWFLCGWSGGPNHYVERFGHPRLRARHLPFSIGVAERDQWLQCFALALQDSPVEAGLQRQLLQTLAGTADWMRNRPEPEGSARADA